MQVRCPHCQSAIEVLESSSLDSVDCGSCGSIFSLLSEDTLDFSADDSVRTLGHFELVEMLGHGSHGSVWKARDLDLDRVVAVKIPRREIVTRTESEFFLREAQAAAQLHHENIVRVYEVGRDEDMLYIVTDFVAGDTLSDWLLAHQPTLRETAELCATLADALHHAHEYGVVHRDLKPANIMMGKDNQPYIMDFGLAKRESNDATLTADGRVMGTPAYMSPEQAQGEAARADRRADIYALGVIMFEMMTGERPHRGSQRMVLEQKVNEDAPSPRKLNATIPMDLETICLKCLERQPARRYATAQIASEELRRYLRGEPILARPITAPGRAWRWCRRNPVVSVLSAGLLASLIVGMIGVTTQWFRANREATYARKEASRATEAAHNERQAHQQTGQTLYVAHMNLAQQAFEQSDPDRVNEILARHQPNGGADDLRSYEWYYWWRQCNRWRSTFLSEGPVVAAAISPDGSRVIAGGADGIARMWSVAGNDEPTLLADHERQIFSVAWSPNGQVIATGSGDKTIKLWDAENAKLIKTLPDHAGTIFSLAFSSDGKTLASAGSDTKVLLWDVETWTVRATLEGHIDFVYAVDISPDGAWVASAGLDRTVRIWDAATGDPLDTLRGHEIEVWCLDFSPDSKRLATGSGDKTVKVWNVESGEELATLRGHLDRVRGVAFAPDGNVIASVSGDRTLRLWDLTREDPAPDDNPRRNLKRRPVHFFERMTLPTRKLVKTIRAHANSINAVGFSRNGRGLVTASDDQRVRAWLTSDLQERDLIQDHERSVTAVAFSHDGATMLSGSNDRTVRLWNVTMAAPIGEPLSHDSSVWSAAFSPVDSTTVGTGTANGKVSLWHAGEPTILEGHKGPVSAIAFSPDGSKLASAGHDNTVRVWEVSSGLELLRLEGHEDRVQAVVFVDNHSLASAGRDQTIKIWDLMAQTHRNLPGHTNWIWCLALSADGETLASGSEDRTIKLWDVASGKELRTIQGHAAFVQSLTFSPDGRTLASGGGDKLVKLWDLKTGEQKTTLKGHQYRVWSVAFSPDGSTLASASYEVRLWRAAKR